jgi:hypothetical protein
VEEVFVMNVTQSLQATLDQLGVLQQTPRSISLQHDGRTIELQLLELNSLACAFQSLSVAVPALASAGIEELQAISKNLCRRLTYLLEPIQPIEIDSEQCSVQMRSSPPSVDDNETSYYELLVRKPGQIVLMRFVKQPGETRRTVPAEVTRAVLCRLVNDLCDASRH